MAARPRWIRRKVEWRELLAVESELGASDGRFAPMFAEVVFKGVVVGDAVVVATLGSGVVETNRSGSYPGLK